MAKNTNLSTIESKKQTKQTRRTDTQIQEAQRVPNKMDAESSPARYVIIKMPNIKDKKDNLKGCKTKAVS